MNINLKIHNNYMKKSRKMQIRNRRKLIIGDITFFEQKDFNILKI